MSFTLSADTVYLGHSCSIDEAEALHQALAGMDQPIFDLSSVAYLHTAIVQLVIAAGGSVLNPPDDPVLAACLVGCARARSSS
jgi:hypothetical protein